jgi:hypothetical protein
VKRGVGGGLGRQGGNLRCTTCGRMTRSASTFAMCLVAVGVSHGQTSPLDYRVRGAERTLRYEGVKTEPYGGSLTLLSFTTGKAINPIPGKDVSQMQVQFFAPGNVKSRLRVREMHSVKSYLLDAEHDWKAGRNSFVWPKDEVLGPLQIDLRNLGVVIGTSPGMSGTVYPARFAGAAESSPERVYTIIVQSKYTCSPMLAVLIRDTPKGQVRIASLSHRETGALMPTVLEFDSTNLSEGSYSVQVSCERRGSGTGAGADSRQLAVYDFNHVPAWAEVPALPARTR